MMSPWFFEAAWDHRTSLFTSLPTRIWHVKFSSLLHLPQWRKWVSYMACCLMFVTQVDCVHCPSGLSLWLVVLICHCGRYKLSNGTYQYVETTLLHQPVNTPIHIHWLGQERCQQECHLFLGKGLDQSHTVYRSASDTECSFALLRAHEVCSIASSVFFKKNFVVDQVVRVRIWKSQATSASFCLTDTLNP